MIFFWLGMAVLMLIAGIGLWWSLPRPWSFGKSILLGVLLLGFIGGYAYWGSWPQLNQWYALQRQQALVADYLAQHNEPSQIIEQLMQRLREDPTSHQGWYLLGRLLVGQQDYPAATLAFQRALALQPEHSDTLFQLAQTDFLQQQGQLSVQGEQWLTQLLILDTEHVEALNLAAVVAYQNEQYQQAIDYWQRLLTVSPSDDEQHGLVLQAIAKAQQQLQGG